MNNRSQNFAAALPWYLLSVVSVCLFLVGSLIQAPSGNDSLDTGSSDSSGSSWYSDGGSSDSDSGGWDWSSDSGSDSGDSGGWDSGGDSGGWDSGGDSGGWDSGGGSDSGSW
jgi:hypothetical protein